MNMTPIDTLRANLANLSPNDAQFAHSLLGARSLSSKQLHWIGVLADRATKAAQAPERPAEMVGNVAGIVALFDRGSRNLKHPKIAFRVDERDLKLSIAGDRARFPGSINVTDPLGRDWFGRIHRDGRWEPCIRIEDDLASQVLQALQAFAADPAGIARQYGRTTGNCCFCMRALTDPVSVDAGFGPRCAENFGLDRVAEAAASRAATDNLI